jgi:hypothetical protein
MDRKAIAMMKATGFLVGVGLTGTAFVLLLDAWNYQPPDELVTGGGDPTPEQLATVAETIAEQVDVLPVERDSDQTVALTREAAIIDQPGGSAEIPADIAPEVSSQASTVILAQTEDRQTTEEPAEAAQPDHGSGTADTETQHQGGEFVPGERQQALSQVKAEAVADSSNSEDSLQTHLFWSPFRSEWAAKGFARRLTNSTQIPIEVINAGPGHYRAAFNYQDETERLEHIERIETITGLQLE